MVVHEMAPEWMDRAAAAVKARPAVAVSRKNKLATIQVKGI
jgi:hypothetical protein